MNERIKELYDQATVYYSNGYVDCPELDWKKFAELIVRKCAYVADRAVAEDMGWDIGEIIKEHFGVEE